MRECTCVSVITFMFDGLTHSLQLSSFVEYTWRCMKLPTLDIATDPCVELSTGEEPVMADADSTTPGEQGRERKREEGREEELVHSE